LIRYRARVYLSEPFSTVREFGWRSAPEDIVLARSPRAAARICYWRLTSPKRAACAYVLIVPFDRPQDESFLNYDGPEVAFLPSANWREHDQPA
jgi:hypothetical protein